jgi:hypothetical protein
MKKIESIKILHDYDDNSDTSFFGECSDVVKPGCIIRSSRMFIEDLPDDEHLPEKGREYRFFHPSDSGETVGSDNYRKYALQNYDRMEQLNNGYFHYIGISAEAKVLTSYDGKNWLINTLSSGGLWGIESDSDSEYINEVQSEQLSELKDVLIEYGFTEQEINEKLSEVIYP